MDTNERPGDAEAAQLADDIEAERAFYVREAEREREAEAEELGLPATCPDCGYDLKGDGYPIEHQRDPDGRICAVKLRF